MIALDFCIKNRTKEIGSTSLRLRVLLLHICSSAYKFRVKTGELARIKVDSAISYYYWSLAGPLYKKHCYRVSTRFFNPIFCFFF